MGDIEGVKTMKNNRINGRHYSTSKVKIIVEMEVTPFSANVRKFRIKAGLTQEELGKAIKKSRVMVNNMESGNNLTTLDTLLDLCLVLNVTPNDLLGFDGANHEVLDMINQPEEQK